MRNLAAHLGGVRGTPVEKLVYIVVNLKRVTVDGYVRIREEKRSAPRYVLY